MTIVDAILHRLCTGDSRGQKVGEVGLTDHGLLYLEKLAADNAADAFDRIAAERYLADDRMQAKLQQVKDEGRARRALELQRSEAGSRKPCEDCK